MYKVILIIILIINTYCYSKTSNKEIISKLNKLKQVTKCDIQITSGYRTKTKNEAVGGAPNSYHLRNKAVDIIISGCNYTNLQFGNLACDLFKGVIVYRTHIHLDVRMKKFHTCKISNKYIEIKAKACNNMFEKSQKKRQRKK